MATTAAAGLVGHVAEAPLAEILNGAAAMGLRRRTRSSSTLDRWLPGAQHLNENAAIVATAARIGFRRRSLRCTR